MRFEECEVKTAKRCLKKVALPNFPQRFSQDQRLGSVDLQSFVMSQAFDNRSERPPLRNALALLEISSDASMERERETEQQGGVFGNLPGAPADLSAIFRIGGNDDGETLTECAAIW